MDAGDQLPCERRGVRRRAPPRRLPLWLFPAGTCSASAGAGETTFTASEAVCAAGAACCDAGTAREGVVASGGLNCGRSACACAAAAARASPRPRDAPPRRPLEVVERPRRLGRARSGWTSGGGGVPSASRFFVWHRGRAGRRAFNSLLLTCRNLPRFCLRIAGAGGLLEAGFACRLGLWRVEDFRLPFGQLHGVVGIHPVDMNVAGVGQLLNEIQE